VMTKKGFHGRRNRKKAPNEDLLRSLRRRIAAPQPMVKHKIIADVADSSRL
jgi:hypothetical protein